MASPPPNPPRDPTPPPNRHPTENEEVLDSDEEAAVVEAALMASMGFATFGASKVVKRKAHTLDYTVVDGAPDEEGGWGGTGSNTGALGTRRRRVEVREEEGGKSLLFENLEGHGLDGFGASETGGVVRLPVQQGQGEGEDGGQAFPWLTEGTGLDRFGASESGRWGEQGGARREGQEEGFYRREFVEDPWVGLYRD